MLKGEVTITYSTHKYLYQTGITYSTHKYLTKQVFYIFVFYSCVFPKTVAA